jgi:hypothetical protein
MHALGGQVYSVILLSLSLSLSLSLPLSSSVQAKTEGLPLPLVRSTMACSYLGCTLLAAFNSASTLQHVYGIVYHTTIVSICIACRVVIHQALLGQTSNYSSSNRRENYVWISISQTHPAASSSVLYSDGCLKPSSYCLNQSLNLVNHQLCIIFSLIRYSFNRLFNLMVSYHILKL